MAKKRRRAAQTIRAVGGELSHLNKVSFGADSSTAVGESIPNPAYREAATERYLGMEITSVRVFPKFSALAMAAVPTTLNFITQIQTGDQSAAPAIMDLDNEFLFAHGLKSLFLSSGVGFQVVEFWPVEMEPVKASNIIVTPEFTVMHDAEINHAVFQSKELQTVIQYRVVEVPDRLFTQMLMNQSRTS